MRFNRHTVFLIHGGTAEQREKYAEELLSTAFESKALRVYVECATVAELPDAFDLKPDFVVCCTGHIDEINLGLLPVHYYNFVKLDVEAEHTTLKVSMIADLDLWMSTLLPERKKWIVIGDLHSCIDELYLMLKHYGCEIDDGDVKAPKDTGILFVGDLIDKGVKTRETVEFLWKNMTEFFFVRGNHDEFVYEYLDTEGKNPRGDDEDYVAHHDSIPFFQDPENADVREKFFELYQFLREFAECPDFIVTHSPCFYHELGMLHPDALALQRKMKLDHSMTLTSQMQCLENNPEEGEKYHISGHIPFKPYHFQGNKIGVDSGCIHGHALGSVLIDCDGDDEPSFYIQPYLEIQPIYPEELVLRKDDGSCL